MQGADVGARVYRLAPASSRYTPAMRSLATCVLALLVQAGGGVLPLGPEEFRSIHDRLTPETKELWEQVPWTIDMLKARTKAQETKKPIFLWAMNGHPLGCT